LCPGKDFDEAPTLREGKLSDLLWTVFGRELISIQRGMLCIRAEIAGLGKTRRYPIQDCAPFRVQGKFFPEGGRSSSRFSFGTIGFDCQGKTHWFGRSLEEAEAQAVVAQIHALMRLGG
jgi:hypothetical protein